MTQRLLTSSPAGWLVPHYSWRILWLIGLPTGLLLVLLNRWIPESPRFLIASGRGEEARIIMDTYGAETLAGPEPEPSVKLVRTATIGGCSARRLSVLPWRSACSASRWG